MKSWNMSMFVVTLLDPDQRSKVCGKLVKAMKIQGCMDTSDDEGSASRVDCAKRKAEDIYFWATSGGRTSGDCIWVMCKENGLLEEVVQLSNEGKMKRRKQCKV